MSKLKLVGFGLLIVLTLVGVAFSSSSSHTQVVGRIAPDDLTEIQGLVRHELRFWLLPKMDWGSLLHPMYVINSVAEYRAQRILWAEVHSDGSVEVFAGISKNVIRDEGHAVLLRKEPEWKITGYAYWASSNAAPAGIHVPP